MSTVSFWCLVDPSSDVTPKILWKSRVTDNTVVISASGKELHIPLTEEEKSQRVKYLFARTCVFIREISELRRKETYLCFAKTPFEFQDNDDIFEEDDNIPLPTPYSIKIQ